MGKKTKKPAENDNGVVETTEESGLPKYKNTCKGKFALLGMVWKSGESLPVPEDIQDSKKFKNAIRVKVLVKA